MFFALLLKIGDIQPLGVLINVFPSSRSCFLAKDGSSSPLSLRASRL